MPTNINNQTLAAAERAACYPPISATVEELERYGSFDSLREVQGWVILRGPVSSRGTHINFVWKKGARLARSWESRYPDGSGILERGQDEPRPVKVALEWAIEMEERAYAHRHLLEVRDLFLAP